MTILQDRDKQVFSSGILRLVGYGLLLMALVDLFFLLDSTAIDESSVGVSDYGGNCGENTRDASWVWF